MSKTIIVDENDRRIGLKNREDIKQEEIYRVSALWIENSKGDVLLAQRSFDKNNNPGQWGPAVAGTVEEDEDYDSNIYKEAEEEIGLRGEIFQKINKTVRRRGEHNFFLQRYYLKIDKDLEYFKIQENEVEAIKWFSKEELEKELKTNSDKFLPSTKILLEAIKKFTQQ